MPGVARWNFVFARRGRGGAFAVLYQGFRHEFRNLAPLTRKRVHHRRVIGPRMNSKLSWLIWGIAVLATIWVLLYVVGYYLGEVGN
jgi:hypothetical protein